MISEVYNIDCLEYMATVPDKYFSLSLVDPPYGIGASSTKFINGTSKSVKSYFRETCWDTTPPTKEYFDELKRISVNQIIWGGNYFADKVPVSRGWVVWDKGTGDNDYADGELAWTSFDRVLKIFKKTWVGANAKNETDRIHPTEKPVQLYKWLLKNYAKEGDKIFDSHMGSQSSRIACYDGGFDFWGCELDKEYFDAGNKRFEIFKAQGKLF
jgi:site-specific DNA-methyltransferase (adenine-specific)